MHCRILRQTSANKDNFLKPFIKSKCTLNEKQVDDHGNSICTNKCMTDQLVGYSEKENTNQEILTTSYYIFLLQYPTFMCCSLAQEKVSVQNYFNNTIDRCHYSALSKEKQCQDLKKKKKLVDRGSEQASSQIQYHSYTNREKATMDRNASHFYLYQIYFTILIQEICLFAVHPKQQSGELH